MMKQQALAPELDALKRGIKMIKWVFLGLDGYI